MFTEVRHSLLSFKDFTTYDRLLKPKPLYWVTNISHPKVYSQAPQEAMMNE